MARGTGLSQAIYYAKNIVASPAGNTVTVTFNAAARMRTCVSPSTSASTGSPRSTARRPDPGQRAAASSGAVTTTNANDLLFGAGMTTGSFTGATDGSVVRVITIPDADIVQDRIVSSVGSYSDRPQSGNHVMQVVAFRGAAQ